MFYKVPQGYSVVLQMTGLVSEREIHLIAVRSIDRRYLWLMPENESINKERIENELRGLTQPEPGMEYYYSSVVKLTKRGYISIPKETRETAGLTGGDVIIVGLFNSFEI